LTRRKLDNLTIAAAMLAVALSTILASAQTSQPPAQTDQSSEPAPPSGKVLFSRDTTQQPDSQPSASNQPHTPPLADSLAVTDDERSALSFTAYDLDVHLTPASAAISARVGITVRNDSALPLRRLILQITSTLHWDSISNHTAAGAITPIPFATHRVETDADHTGEMEEAVLTLPQPLAPGAAITLATLYSGTIQPSAHRLERIGAPTGQALAEDWDEIAALNSDPDAQLGGTALRGFGNVLWYPVSSPPVFLGEGASLFQSVGATKRRQSAASIRLRLAIEYIGDPPDAAFFCGHRQQLIATSDNPNLPVAESPGIATAIFDSRPLGFRTPSLFITGIAPSNTGTSGNSNLIAAITNRYDALPSYAAAATMVEPLLTGWFGPQPLTPLTILDHDGQPFEDDALLVRPMHAVDPTTLAPSLAHSLTHAWFRSSHAWIDEGLAQFMSILWTESTAGRPAALAELQQAARSLALAEPEIPTDDSVASSSSSSKSVSSASNPPNSSTSAAPSVSPDGTSLADATGDVFYRTKAAAVWWMLRSLLGDDPLKESLQAYCRDPKLDHDPEGLEHTLERISHKDLSWFFNDWVYRDRGLPDLSIVSITPSPQQGRTGLPTGYLVAIVVRNDGYATADVPVTVRSSDASQTERMRIPGRSSVSTRIVFAGTPELVEVNDGSVPETVTSIHTRQLVLPVH
jgi:hypothetical protein